MWSFSDSGTDFLTLKQKKASFFILLLLYLLLCFAYQALPQGHRAFPGLFAIYTAQFLVYGCLLLLLRFFNPKLPLLFVTVVIARLILIQTAPVLENDYWRYLWDGRVLAHGINPYSYKPLNQELNHLDVFYRQLIGWKQYGTIYPPISIAVFALTHLIVPDSLLALKIVLVLFDLATGGILVLWLKRFNIPIKWSFVYFLSPLLLKEIANSAHLDSIAVFFTTLSVFLFYSSHKTQQQNWMALLSWVVLCLAVASKLYAICLLPFFFKLDRSRWRNLSIFLFCLFLLYGPFLSTGYNLLNGTTAFGQHWIFNASIFKVIQKFMVTTVLFLQDTFHLDARLASIVLHNDSLAKVIVAVLFVAVIINRTMKIKSVEDLPTEVGNTIGALLLLSPVVNGWYLTWLLPFAALTKSKHWLMFSYVVVASYAWWYSRQLAFYFKWLEYIILFISLYFAASPSFWKTKKSKFLKADNI